MVPHIPPEVADRLGWYVYVYVDPRDRRIFYVARDGVAVCSPI